MLVSSANAAPVLSKGSFAGYDFSGDFEASMTCDADVIAYNRTACGPYQPTYYVSIWESPPGTCSSPGNCGFSPSTLYVSEGYGVVWQNNGQLPHTVVSCSSDNNPSSTACPSMNDPSLPSFRSPILNSGGNYEIIFDTPGTYYYYCEIHSYLHGTVIVSGPGPSPSPSPPGVSLTGAIGWEVLAINEVALLNVSHSISLTIQPSGPSFNEAGSVEESVELATRLHESGTLTELIETLAQAYALALSSYSYYYRPPIFAALQGYTPEIYTFWWVNGPLTDSSPVEILVGYSGVRGSETLNLGGTIGQRDSWIVASEITQSFTTQTPSPDTMTMAHVGLSLRFSFDKTNDLMLKSVFLVDVLATMVTTYQAGETLCGSGGCRTVSQPVVVTRQMAATASLTLQLEDTNVPLNRRTNPQSTPGGTTSTSEGPPSNPPGSPGQEASLLLPYGIAGAIALGAAGAVAWLVKGRSKPKVSLEPTTMPPSTPQ